MIYCDQLQVSVHGMDFEILAEFGMVAGDIAEKLGKDKVLESAILGLYAENRDQMRRIHELLKESGMNV